MADQVSRLRWAVAGSTCLHVALLLMMAVRFAPPLSSIPIGIELRYSEPGAGALTNIKARTRREAGIGKKAGKERARQERQEASTTSGRRPMGSPDGAAVSALERYKFELRLFLDSRKRYPEMARRLRQTGTVIVRFKIDATGALTQARLDKPSSVESLNRAALDLIRRAARFKPLPEEVGFKEINLTFPIEYVL